MISEKRRLQKRAAMQRYCIKHREKIRLAAKALHQKNKERNNAYSRQYRIDHPEETRERMKRYIEENRENISKQRKDRRLLDPSVRERERVRDVRDRAKRNLQRRESAKRNHQKTLANVRKYNASHPEIRKAIEKRYHDSHPTVRTASHANRRALHMKIVGTHTPADILAIWERQGKKCAIPFCSWPISEKSGKHKYHVDHIIPLKLRGTNWPSNLQILCSHHNRSKWALSPEKWAERLAATCAVVPT